MKTEVILLSGTLKLSGSTTWLNGLAVGFEKLGIPYIHLVTGIKGDFSSRAKRVFYTGRSRSSFYIKLLRWLQVHKVCGSYFYKVEQGFFNKKIKKLLKESLADKVLVIKDFTSYLPECFTGPGFVVVDVLHQQFLECQQAGYSNWLIAVSQSVMDDSLALGFDVNKVIYNPLDVQQVLEQSKQYTAVEEKPYIVFVGNLYEEKGVFDLLESFRDLANKELAQYKLLYIGQGKHLALLKERAQQLGLAERVEFKGMLENPYPWIAAAKLLILPSYSEAMAYVVLEASVLDTPSIVADFSAAKEFYLNSNIFKGTESIERVENLKNLIVKMLVTPCNAMRPELLELMKPEKVASEYYKLLSEVAP